MRYAGDVTSEQAYDALRADPHAVLVDVRTRAEWAYVGLPVLDAVGKDVICLEWQTFPDGGLNPHFLDDLRAAGVGDEQSVYFLCRSGARSASAASALTAAGGGPAYNIADGFEGPHDPHGHRSVAGWKAAGLPWRQG